MFSSVTSASYTILGTKGLLRSTEEHKGFRHCVLADLSVRWFTDVSIAHHLRRRYSQGAPNWRPKPLASQPISTVAHYFEFSSTSTGGNMRG